MDRKVTDQLLPTTMVGSYPAAAVVPPPAGRPRRARGDQARGALQAYEDAVGAVIRDQESVGLDIVTDGQMYWDDYASTIGSFPGTGTSACRASTPSSARTRSRRAA